MTETAQRTSIRVDGSLSAVWHKAMRDARPNLPTAEWLILYAYALDRTATSAYTQPALCNPNVQASATEARNETTGVQIVNLGPSMLDQPERFGGVAETLRALEERLRLAGQAALSALKIAPSGARNVRPAADDHVWTGGQLHQTIHRASIGLQTSVRTAQMASHELTFATEGGSNTCLSTGRASLAIGHELAEDSAVLWADVRGNYQTTCGWDESIRQDTFRAFGQFIRVAELVAGGGRMSAFAE